VIPYCKPFKCDFSYSYAAVDKISTDLPHHVVPELIAEHVKT